MKYIDVCSGISAPTQAWKPLGWEALCFAEIEAAPRSVLAHHYPDTPLRGDFTEIEGNEYGPVDLLVGGTPCQSFSVAGLRGGIHDGRGNLALEFLRLLARSRARWVVWENVPGVFSSVSHPAPDFSPPNIDLDAGDGPADGEEIMVEDSYDADESHAFSCFLAGLSELGYGIAYRVLDAQYAGVPQRRRRVFVVGYLGDWRRAAAVLFERHSLSGDTPPRREAGQRIAGTLKACAGKSGTPNGAEEADRLIVFDRQSNCEYGAGEIASTIHARDYKSATDLIAIQERAVSENPDAGPDGAGFRTDGQAYTLEARSVPQAIAFAQNSRDEVRVFGDDGQSVGALAAEPGMKQQCYVAFQSSQSGVREVEIAPTLDANNGSRRHNGIATASAVRRLTPRECERLQGFPDDFTLVPHRNKPMADGPRYKMLGNSMAVPVLRWIGQRIAMVDAMPAAGSLAA